VSEMRRAHLLLAGAILASIAGGALAADETNARPEATESNEPFSPEAYWEQATSEIFRDIELTETQESEIETLLAEAAAGRARYTNVQARLKLARREGDTKLSSELSDELIQIRETFRPQGRMLKMSDLLTDEQRAIFARNMRLRDDRITAERWAKQREAREKSQNPEMIETKGPTE
jgi:hypothetical protein